MKTHRVTFTVTVLVLFCFCLGCTVRVQNSRADALKVRSAHGEGNSTEIDYTSGKNAEVEAGNVRVVTEVKTSQ
jgi:hypothetical protein